MRPTVSISSQTFHGTLGWRVVPSSYTESPQAPEENELVDRDTPPPPIANLQSTAQGREAGLVRDLGSICVRPQSRIHFLVSLVAVMLGRKMTQNFKYPSVANKRSRRI